jgi:HJR/Mrr/RecB family endonuclease
VRPPATHVRLPRNVPELPLSIARAGGWDGFPKGWPDQVVVAQWSAPRPGEFQDGVESALATVRTAILYEDLKPSIELYSALSDELLARLAESPEDRFRLDPYVFEEVVAELLSRMGYEIRLTPRSGDAGRDVIAAIGTPAARLLMLVECKKYAAHRRVGIEPVTRFWSRLFDDHANMAMVVTTSTFQPVAQRFAVSRGYQVSLKDGNDFIGWIRSIRQHNDDCGPIQTSPKE